MLSNNAEDVRKADNRLINNLQRIEDNKLDYNINTKIVRGAMKTKVWLEDNGIWNKGSFSSMKGNELPVEDRELLERNLRKMTLEGYGLHIIDKIISFNKLKNK